MYIKAFKKEKVDGKRLVTFNTAETLRNVFPQISVTHAQAMQKQIDILKVREGEGGLNVRFAMSSGIEISTYGFCANNTKFIVIN